jgi:phosphoglycolate phosphatase
MTGTAVRRAYDLVSFDLDGTLVDTAGEIAEAANRALEEHGIARRPAAEVERLIGTGTRDLMIALLARCVAERPALLDRVRPEAVLASFDRHYAQTTGTTTTPYGGGREALARLREAGVRLACVTNKELRHARAVLRASRLTEAFDLVVGGDCLPQRKPHASVLRHVTAALGVPPGRSAHVGDSAIDIEAARNAGVSAWAVPYGYNGGVPVAEARPQRPFRDLQQVADHVLADVMP